MINLFTKTPFTLLALACFTCYLYSFRTFYSQYVTTQQYQQQHIDEEDRHGNAILHVGSRHDVAFTSVRDFISQDEVFFSKDGYDVKYFSHELIQCLGIGAAAAVEEHHCELQNLKSSSGEEHENVILTSDGLSWPLDMTKLSSFLRPWRRVDIVFVYRRFHEWLPSVYYRHFVETVSSLEKGGVDSQEPFPSFVHWLTEKRMQILFNRDFTSSIVENYLKHFENVSVISSHEGKDIISELYCGVITNARDSCYVARDRLENGEGFTYFLDEFNLDFHRLALAARQKGFLAKDVSIALAASKARNYKNERKSVSLPMDCVKPGLLKDIKNLSLEAEKSLHSKGLLSASALDQSNFKMDIERSKKGSFCSLNVDQTLEYGIWQEFFRRIKNSNDVQEVSNVVLHVGPLKMASITIQQALREDNEVLKTDQYLTRSPAHTIAFCMGGKLRSCKRKGYPHNFQQQVDNFVANNQSTIFSSEALSISGVDIERLSRAFQPLVNVTVIVMYRRFYEWLPSYYFQRHKSHQKGINQTYDIVEWLTPERVRGFYETRYTLGTYERFRRYFKNVVVFNMHDTENIILDLYCKYIPRATNTCLNTKKRIEKGDKYRKANPSTTLEYDRLVKAARKKGLLNEHVKQGDAVRRARKRQQVNLNLTEYDFPQVCMDPMLLDSVLETSLKVEKRMFPDFYASSRGEDELRAGFAKAAKKKYCNADVDKVLDDERWKEFFLSLRP